MTHDELEARLSAAGRTLLALPTVAVITRDQRAGWPEIVRDAVTAFGGDRRFRHLPPPSRAALEDMVEAFDWIGLVAELRLQRVLFLRALTHPVAGTALHSWRGIGAMLGFSGTAVQNWHRQAVAQIAQYVAYSAPTADPPKESAPSPLRNASVPDRNEKILSY